MGNETGRKRLTRGLVETLEQEVGQKELKGKRERAELLPFFVICLAECARFLITRLTNE